jgi:hypothetical protein
MNNPVWVLGPSTLIHHPAPLSRDHGPWPIINGPGQLRLETYSCATWL